MWFADWNDRHLFVQNFMLLKSICSFFYYAVDFFAIKLFFSKISSPQKKYVKNGNKKIVQFTFVPTAVKHIFILGLLVVDTSSFKHSTDRKIRKMKMIQIEYKQDQKLPRSGISGSITKRFPRSHLPR